MVRPNSPLRPGTGRDGTWVKGGRWQGLPGVRFPGPGPQHPSGSHPRPCLAYTGATASSSPPARPEGSTPHARLGSPQVGTLSGSAPPRSPAPGAPWPGSTSPFTSAPRGRRKDRPSGDTRPTTREPGGEESDTSRQRP